MFWWQYILLVVAGMFFGVFLSASVYFLISYFHNRKLKKLLPSKDKKEISRWLEQEDVKKALLNPGNVKISDKKEAEEDERERFNKYREFEKLRRISQGKSELNQAIKDKGDGRELRERWSISGKPDFGDTTDEPKSKRGISFD